MISPVDIDARFAEARAEVHALCVSGDLDRATRLVRALSRSLLAAADDADAGYIAFQAESLRSTYRLAR